VIEGPVVETTEEPWFRDHPRLAAAVAIGLFAGVYVLRSVVTDTDLMR
jgi:hypothetical protein